MRWPRLQSTRAAVCALLATLSTNFGAVDAGEIRQSSFLRVPTQNMVDQHCMLGEVPLEYGPYGLLYAYFECAKLCIGTPECTLFCISSDLHSCLIYNLFMTNTFNEKAFGSETVTPVFACYSTWAHGRNILSSALRSKSSPSDSATTTSEKAMDGVCCLRSFTSFRSKGASQQKNFWVVDLSKVVAVAELRIAGSYRYFHSVAIHLGNSTDDASNPVVAEIGTSTVGDNKVHLTPEKAGRYLSIRSSTSEMLDLCEIQVITAP